MKWSLSQFKPGDCVEVRSHEEILASLDQLGCLDRLPFMPEMLKFCGSRLRVTAVAHKTCDTARQTWKGRRLNATVHLEGVRCDGSAHDGCQAECNLFWKDAWLKPVGETVGAVTRTEADRGALCTEAHLFAATRHPRKEGEALRYRCQATEMYNATEALAWWDLRQYVYDVTTRNHSLRRVIRVLLLASLRWILSQAPFGYRVLKCLTDWIHERLTGRPSPYLHGKVKQGIPTPTGRFDLHPGEYVRIKSQREIEETLDETGRNRGLTFDGDEMAPYCGGVFKVERRISKIIDEPTGMMLHMKQPCVTLDGVVCKAEYASCRLNCPRAIPSYWREIWLERVNVERPVPQANSFPGTQAAKV